MRYGRALLTHPALWPEALRAGWSMRRPRWWASAPFLPLPDRVYVDWRAATAYGSAGVDIDPSDLAAYLGWRKRLRRAAR